MEGVRLPAPSEGYSLQIYGLGRETLLKQEIDEDFTDVALPIKDSSKKSLFETISNKLHFDQPC